MLSLLAKINNTSNRSKWRANNIESAGSRLDKFRGTDVNCFAIYNTSLLVSFNRLRRTEGI